MDIEELNVKISGYEEQAFINVTNFNTDTNLFAGTLVLTNGEILSYGYGQDKVGYINSIATVGLDKIENFKNYLLNNVKVFNKPYQNNNIFNKEYRCFINIDGKIIRTTNDFINIYEPTLYKDLCFKINYLIKTVSPIPKEEIDSVIKQNPVKIKSNLKGFSSGLETYKTFFKKRNAIKIQKNLNVYKCYNENVCYWAIRLLREKYDSIFNAPGSKLKQDGNITYLHANYNDWSFVTLEEKQVLIDTLKQLLEEIKSLK